ncbi:MAG TPA: hypothetical protein VF753_04115 [Terriglobales bacterium]
MKMWGWVLAAAVIFPAAMMGQAGTAAASAASQGDRQSDGMHGFDFEVGTWKIHLKKLMNPMTGSKDWVEFDGTSTTRKIWNGQGQIEQFETDSPMGHIEGLTLRLYDPGSHQWRLYWANSRNGVMDPPQVGEFKNGTGEFYAQDTINGKVMLIRFIWSKTDTEAPHFEQSFSDDGGKTWEVNWITDQTRVPEETFKANATPTTVQASGAGASAERDGQHDFDFIFGNWNVQLKRRVHSATGEDKWTEFSGYASYEKLWDGRANINEFEANSPTGHVLGMTLRTYDPRSHQWRLYWANSKDGIVDVPQIGEFKDGVGEFYAQDTIEGKSVLIRYVWSKITPTSVHFEQSISSDGGKTWEANWVSDMTCAGDAPNKAH